MLPLNVTMNQETRIETDACLLIFDPHQDVEWMEAIIASERKHVSHVLLGGDYFDSDRPKVTAHAGRMCDSLVQLAGEWADQITVLLGNHDVHYMETKRWCDLHRTPRAPHVNYRCSGYTTSRAAKIAKKLSWEFWRGCRLFQVVNGWLVSHAGVAGRFWPPAPDTSAAIDALEKECREAVEKLPFNNFEILQAGEVRGGRPQAIGGITWLDFDREFVDGEVPLPQIFGHTTSHEGARQKGRSWCLDGHQTCYGILHRDGNLEIKERRS